MNAMDWRVFVVAVVLMAGCQCMDAEEGKEMIRAMSSDCKVESGASDEDVENMIAKKMPDSKPSKCLNACMMKLFNIIETKKFNPDGLTEVTRVATEGDEKMVQMAKEMGESCKAVDDPDECELAFKVMECLDAEATKRGIKE